MDMGQQFQSNAINARSAMRPIKEEAEKTAGGALMSGAGMAAAGGTLGASMTAGTTTGGTVGGLWGAGIGAAVGIAAYLLS